MAGSRLSILTEQAKKTSDLDAAAADALMVEARAMPNVTDEEHDGKTKAVTRAQVQLKLTKK